MSAFWHWYIIVITIGTILGCIWLIWFAGQKNQTNSEAGEAVGHEWDGIYELNHPMPRWWLWLFYATIIFAFVYLALYPGLGNFAGVLGWTQQGQHAEQVAELDARREAYVARFDGMSLDELQADTDAMRIGASVFAHNCALCHGSDARGAPGFPNLTDEVWNWGGDPETVLTSVRNGRNGIMPALGAATGDDGYAVATWVYHLNGRTLPYVGSASLETGERQFGQMCAACHGPAGTGNQMLGAPDLTDDVWIYGDSLQDIQRAVQNGLNNAMPAHGTLLGEQRVRLVTAYVLGLNEMEDRR